MKVRVHVFINGRVQGVFFRSSTRREAKRRGVNGWVRNLRDGRVEAIFEGEKGSVDSLIEFCKEGPPSAKVNDLDVTWEDYKGEFNHFRIRYNS